MLGMGDRRSRCLRAGSANDLEFSAGAVIQGAPPALSSWVHQLIDYVRTLGLGMPRAAIGLVIGLLAGAAVGGGDRRLSTGCADR